MPRVLGIMLIGILIMTGCGDDDDGSAGSGGTPAAVESGSGGGGGGSDPPVAGGAVGGDGMAGSSGASGAGDGGGESGDSGGEPNEPAVVNVVDGFTYDNELTEYTNNESYSWGVTTGSAVLRFEKIEIIGGSARLFISNPSALPLFDQTYSGTEQVPDQYLGPASATDWKVDVTYEGASGQFVFSLEAVPPPD